MEFLYFETVKTSGYADALQQLLVLADREFIPPLSARGSSTQADLSQEACVSVGAKAYFETMAAQPAILALENGRCLGFMAFKTDYTCEYIGEETLPNLYASTCVVHPDARGKGLMERFYRKMMELFPSCGIYTRTWHTNYAHLHVLDKLGFHLCARLSDHRGPGLDTVYYGKAPTVSK